MGSVQITCLNQPGRKLDFEFKAVYLLQSYSIRIFSPDICAGTGEHPYPVSFSNASSSTD